MTSRRGISKWQAKSTRVNQIRWELEDIVTRDLSPEEKQSDKYQELCEAIISAVDHTVPESRRKIRRRRFVVALLIGLATGSGALIAELLKLLGKLL